MRFKVRFSDRGVRVLEKLFLPTLEKFGRTCQMLLAPNEVFFIQTTANTDGPHVIARFDVNVIFDESTYVIESKHYNLVAFQLDIALLQRVLKGAASNGADTLDAKLSTRTVLSTDGLTQTSKPFLVFQGRGASVALTQDLPISRPYPASEIDHLVAAKEIALLCPYYVDLCSCTARLLGIVDKLRSLGQVLRLATCKSGDLHLQVTGTNVMLGSHIVGLQAFGGALEGQPAAAVDRALSAQEQLLAALEAGEAAEVHLQLKHLAKVLQVSMVMTPSQTLLGLAEDGGFVHVMFVFRDPHQPDSAYDESYGLTFKLPTREEA